MGGRDDIESLPLAVNLLQQTPLDRSAGDVLVQGARVMRLLEFKRQENDDDKETSKLVLLNRMLSARENFDLIPISREVHWFISSKNQNASLNLKIVPYLDFRTAGVRGPNLQKFIDDMVAEAMSTKTDKSALYSRYLRVVANSQGSIKGSSGGLIVSVDGNNKLNYAVVEDLRELGLSLAHLHGIYTERQVRRQQEYELKRARTFYKTPGISR